MPLTIEDWNAVLREPGFWYQYYAAELRNGDGPNVGALAERLFGPHADFNYRALSGGGEGDFGEGEVYDEDADSGSTLVLRFPRDYLWSIEFTAEGIFHTLANDRLPQSLSLGYYDPHFHLPILRWPEVFELAGRPAYLNGRPDTVISPSLVVALLAPVAWASSAREAAYARRGLADAFATAGIVTRGSADEAAERVVLHTDNLVWRPDPALGWINNGHYSHRNPANVDWSPTDFWRFRQFLSGPAHAATSAPAGASPSAPTGRQPAWQVAASGPVGPALTASDDTVLFTTWPGTLHAVDARSGRPLWRVAVPESGYGRAAPVVHQDTVYYAGGRGSIDLVCLPRWGTGDRDGSFTLALDVAESRHSTSDAYAGKVDTTPVIADKTMLVSGDRLHARWLGPTGPQAHWDATVRALAEEMSAPAVADGAAYVMVRDRFEGAAVWAFDLATGSESWQAPTPAASVSRPVADGGEIFVAGRSLLVLDPHTGAELWSVQTEREWSGAIAVTAAHVVGTTCRLAAMTPGDDRSEWCYTVVRVDRKTRTVGWTFTAEARLASAGVVIADGVVCSVGHDDRVGTLFALELATGRLAWQADIGRSSALPAVANGMVYVSSMEGKVSAFPAAGT